MGEIAHNTLYLTTPGTYAVRDHLTRQGEVPEYPPDLPPEEREPKAAIGQRKLSIPIHHLLISGDPELGLLCLFLFGEHVSLSASPSPYSNNSEAYFNRG